MSIDKSINPAPVGLGALAEEDPIEVHIVDLDEEEAPKETKQEEDFSENLAERMDESDLAMLASELLGDYQEDLNSRKEWIDLYVKGMKLLGLKYEERVEPWPGACGVFHPLLMESAVKFQAEMSMETFPAAGPVRTVIVGRETPEKKAAAARVQADMNYTLTEQMVSYRPEHEKCMLTTAITGNAFKKIYFNPSISLPEAPFIPPEDLVVPYGAASIEDADRITHRMRKTENEVRRLQHAGFYRDIDMGTPVHVMDEIEKQKALEQGFSASMDNRFQLLEMHVNVDLKGYEDKDSGTETGIALPYVITIEKGTSRVLAIRRNWEPDDKHKQRRQHFTHYGYIPGFGFYCFGLIHLIGGHTQTATSLMRQLIDAGTLSNLPGGLKAKGLRVKGDDTPIAPGEFRDVDLPSGSIRDNILPLPYKEPSQVLMALMDKVVADGRQFAATADLNISDMSANAPVGTTLAILERVLKVMSAVQARIHYAMKQEFKLLAKIIRENAPVDYEYDPESGDRGAKQSDYDCCEVLPVSDPNASTMAQRVIQYQAVMQLAQQSPQLYNLPFLHRQMIETIGVKNASKIVPLDEDMKPTDPVSENMAIMNGKPVRAFMYQDHQSHLAVHMAAMQDPKLAAMIGQNPKAQAIMAAGAAHVMEHLAYQYRADVQQKLGIPLPPPPKSVLGGPSTGEEDNDGVPLTPTEEVQISQLAALAAQQLLQQNKAQAQQAQIQQQMQDPIIQMQQQELQLKKQALDLEEKIKNAELKMKQDQFTQELSLQKQEQDRKAKKDIIDAAAKADAHKLQETAQAQQHQAEGTRIGVEVAKHKAEMQHKQQVEGTRIGVDVAKHHAEKQHQRLQMGVDLLKHGSQMEHDAAQNDADRESQIQQQPPSGAGEGE